MFIGRFSTACSIRAMCHGPGVTVVALEASEGPAPPPIMVVTPEASATGICCGLTKCTWVSMAPAVRILCSPAMMSVAAPMVMLTPLVMSGLPALPILKMCPSRRATSAL